MSHNLPTPVTPFVGRRTDIQQIISALEASPSVTWVSSNINQGSTFSIYLPRA